LAPLVAGLVVSFLSCCLLSPHHPPVLVDDVAASAVVGHSPSPLVPPQRRHWMTQDAW
jgi:hypothetical protein